MLINKLKTPLFYLLIVAVGLAAGSAVSRIPHWLKAPYTEGNNAAYFPDVHTKVVIYGTATCPFCAKARAYMQAHHVDFADVYLEKSDKAQHEFTELGGGAVPMILIGNRRIQGFNQSAIDAALASLVQSKS